MANMRTIAFTIATAGGIWAFEILVDDLAFDKCP